MRLAEAAWASSNLSATVKKRVGATLLAVTLTGGGMSILTGCEGRDSGPVETVLENHNPAANLVWATFADGSKGYLHNGVPVKVLCLHASGGARATYESDGGSVPFDVATEDLRPVQPDGAVMNQILMLPNCPE